MTRHYCTNFDTEKFFLRGLAMYYSLAKHSENFCLWNLCMDDKTYESLQKLNIKNLKLIKLSEIESENLLRIKKERTLREYCISIKPHLLRYILQKNPQIDSITWLDSDLFFTGSPEFIFEELGSAPILITRSNFPADKSARLNKICGKFNAGLFTFRNNDIAINCLKWWEARCEEWCFNYYEDGKLGEQLYMDKIPELVEETKIASNPGINVAYWNIEAYKFTEENGQIFITEKITQKKWPLVVYHFSGVNLFNVFGRLSYLASRRFMPLDATKLVYNKYENTLNQALKFAKKNLNPRFSAGMVNGKHLEFCLKKVRQIFFTHVHQYPILPEIKRSVSNLLSLILPKMKSYSDDNIDHKLRRYLVPIHDGYFLDILDEKTSKSNTTYFQKNHDWKGLQLKPEPALITNALKQSVSKRINFVSMKGTSNEILLLQSLNLKANKPDYILVNTAQIDRVDSLMENSGYEQIDQFTTNDFLYTTKK